MEYKWKAFSVTSVGSLMSAVDSAIVLLALLPIAGHSGFKAFLGHYLRTTTFQRAQSS